MSFISSKIGVLQLCPTSDKIKNLEVATTLIKEAASQEAKIIFLPEAFDYIGDSRAQTLELSENLGQTTISTMSELARNLGVWLSLGGMHRKVTEEIPKKLLNSHIIINSDGKVAAIYDKVHLFDIQIESDIEGSSLSLKESIYVSAGKDAPVVAMSTPIGNIGLGICYDLRFPELASALRYSGNADVLTYPSAFTVPTGEAGHWHTLLKARAIETQTYVVAAALEGKSNSKRSFYGHSLVVDPWGQIIAEKTDPGPGLLICNINGSENGVIGPGMSIAKARSSIPVSSNRRSDLFPMPDNGKPVKIENRSFIFGPIEIPANHVFLRSNLSYAFVNLSPLVPGHVLVSPVRLVERFEQMTLGEVTDLYALVRTIVPRLAKYFNASSMTIAIQDGKEAGQSVPHVHMHVLPRKFGDFPENDDIYKELNKHDKIPDRVKRDPQVMAEEASNLRTIFY
ncbi:hypothetical protein Ciccas_002602 [Cichlidogyrus casuarinus]|uniref:Bis(5'-adenosyl)-triphosphatase n=1 Tax=Cichlidogyrus casuarinus TaxID=1844966 RepID=A0ABD2QGS6_9PLAT